MFSIEIINEREYLSCMEYVLVHEDWKRIEEMKSLLPGIVATWEIEKEKFLNDIKKEIENF